MTTHTTPGGLIPGTEYFRGLLRSDQRDQAYVVLGLHGVAIDDARHLIYEGDHRPQALDLDRSAFGYGSDPQRSLGASATEHAYWCAPAARGLRGLTGGELF